MRRNLGAAALAVLFCLNAGTILADNTINFAFLDQNLVLYGAVDPDTPDLSAPLPGGDKAVLGDGARIEVYFDEDPGQGVALSLLTDAFTVGDDLRTAPEVPGIQNGRFNFNIVLSRAEILPIVGKQLYLRFYNTPAVVPGAFYGELTNELWTIPADSDDGGTPVAYDLRQPGTVGTPNEHGIGPEIAEGFYTNMEVVPEPATLLLGLAGLGWIIRRRRR